jgi:hypothetical protein
VSLQGRAVQRRIIRELICLGCKYVWPAPKHLAASQAVEPTA